MQNFGTKKKTIELLMVCFHLCNPKYNSNCLPQLVIMCENLYTLHIFKFAYFLPYIYPHMSIV